MNRELDNLVNQLNAIKLVDKLNENTRLGDVSQAEISTFLNKLRKSGKTNMFGATPHIEKEFGISREDAKKALSSWMKNFSSASESRVNEGTWSLPNTVKKAQKLIAAFANAKVTGVLDLDGLYNIFGDDSLWDDLQNSSVDKNSEDNSTLVPYRAAVQIMGTHLGDMLSYYAKDPSQFSEPWDPQSLRLLQQWLRKTANESKVNEAKRIAPVNVQKALQALNRPELKKIQPQLKAAVLNLVAMMDDMRRDDPHDYLKVHEVEEELEGRLTGIKMPPKLLYRVACVVGQLLLSTLPPQDLSGPVDISWEGALDESYESDLKKYKKEAYDHYAKCKISPTAEEILNYVCDCVEDASGADVDDAGAKAIAKKLGLSIDESKGEKALEEEMRELKRDLATARKNGDKSAAGNIQDRIDGLTKKGK